MTCREQVIHSSREFWNRKVDRYIFLYESEYISRDDFKRYMQNMGFEENTLEKLMMKDETI
tara:strand:+ start:6411 stop:6593 length:183 start_codon:yes stop_codon:yes gene_type:complete